MRTRETILDAIRANRPAPRLLPDIPDFDEAIDGDLVGRFSAACEAMGGIVLTGNAAGPLEQIRERIDAAEVVVSMVPEVAGNRTLDVHASPASLADVDIAIVRAVFGIAETGSVAFTERELGINTLAYLGQHLVVLLDPADILGNLHHAYRRPEFSSARYLVFHTGPSATADIEGVLVHGAQGVRSLSIAFVAR